VKITELAWPWPGTPALRRSRQKDQTTRSTSKWKRSKLPRRCPKPGGFVLRGWMSKLNPWCLRVFDQRLGCQPGNNRSSTRLSIPGSTASITALRPRHRCPRLLNPPLHVIEETAHSSCVRRRCCGASRSCPGEPNDRRPTNPAPLPSTCQARNSARPAAQPRSVIRSELSGTT